MKNERHKFVAAITFITFASLYDNSVGNVIVNTTNGPVQGEKRSVENDQGEYYAFHAIPYASPPVSKLRFKPPQPVKNNWITVYNATISNGKSGKKCPQKGRCFFCRAVVK